MAHYHPLPGELALLVSQDNKHFLARLEEGGELHTHAGVVAHDDLMAAPWGTRVRSHTNVNFTVLRPSMEEILRTMKRTTQIMYPKEIGYVLLKLSIVPGARVIEAGTGSGGLTFALARYVTPGGHVYSYDARADHINIARQNIERLGLESSVTFNERDIVEGFVERDVDALFLDVREPWKYLDSVQEALVSGGFFGSLVPTMNQVIRLTEALDRRPFAELEICEIMLRQYKPTPQRIRPEDRLTAHTGYLIFARSRFEGEAAPIVRPTRGADEDAAQNAPAVETDGDVNEAPEVGES